MILHFNPSFDDEHYVDYARRGVVFDEKFVGTLGLLSELELLLGMVGRYGSPVTRIVAYYEVLKCYLDEHNGSFIKESFEVDGLGVAAKLLEWRDELTLALWRSDMRGVSERIDLLADLENRFYCTKNMGVADRWRQVLEALDKAKLTDLKIIVYTNEEHLHPTYNTILKSLEESGAEVVRPQKRAPKAKEGTNLWRIQKMLLGESYERLSGGDRSLQIAHFKDYYSALEYVASQTKNTILINEDNRAYDSIQYTFGKSASGSMATSANPQIIQLFKLGVLLHIGPLNIYNLISYLQVDINPVPTKLRYQLLNIIASEDGVGNEEWCAAIENHKWRSEGERRNFERFLPVSPNENIARSSIVEYCEAMEKWAAQKKILIHNDKRYVLNEALFAEQLEMLIQMCVTLRSIIGASTSELISDQELRALVLAIYTPINYTLNIATRSSSFVIKSASAMADSAERVIYVDCQNANPKATMYQDVSVVEREKLEQYGVKIWSIESQVNMQLDSYKLSILNATKEVILISCDEVKGTPATVHPLIAELMVNGDRMERFVVNNPEPEGSTEVTNEVSPYEPQEQYDFPPQHKDMIHSRPKESYSSISLLNDYPFDYIFNYVAKIRNFEFSSGDAMNRVLGNVAHRYIQQLIDESHNVDELIDIHKNQFPERIESLFHTNGALILLPENRSEREFFISKLDNSINNLFLVIKMAGLTIVGCEVEEEYEEPRIGSVVGAKMDMVLRDKNGGIVIFDMKWSSNRKYYRKLIGDNLALQLELYRNVVERSGRYSRVSWVGYFMLRYGLLYTTYIPQIRIPQINSIESSDDEDIFDAALSIYNDRQEEFREGVIDCVEKNNYSSYKLFKGYLK